MRNMKMVEEQALEASIRDFFLRSGLSSAGSDECHDFLSIYFPGKKIEPARSQGFCSYTVLVGPETIVQFRPPPYQLDVQITAAARRVYKSYAPLTIYMSTLESTGLLVYAMDKMHGISYKDFRATESTMGQAKAFECRKRLCEDFAIFLARSWRTRNSEHLPLGKVGSSLETRLRRLSTELPLRFRPVALRLLRNVNSILDLPWVFTHGDIVAGNIMLDPNNGHLSGFVDWAEAEVLPFGICLYGLEELLGQMTSAGFVRHPHQQALRELFWRRLRSEIPEVDDEQVLHKIRLARDFGVLLWHGFAWDDGAIDRVVKEGKDVEDIRYLQAFLALEVQSSDCRCLMGFEENSVLITVDVGEDINDKMENWSTLRRPDITSKTRQCFENHI